MSRGVHEGEVGVAVYYYNIGKNSVEEKVFITTGQSYGIAIHELSNMLYYNVEQNMLYVMLDGALYECDVKRGWTSTVVEGLQNGQYVISADGSQVAWQEGEELNTASRVMVRDLETGEERIVECQGDECIRPLGFIKNDFVYGGYRKDDIRRGYGSEL